MAYIFIVQEVFVLEANRDEKGANSVNQVSKSWKGYIGWAGFVVTIGVLLQQIYMHGSTLWYYISKAGIQIFGFMGDPQYSTLFRVTSIFGMVNTLVFFALPLVILALLAFRKRIVPKLLVIFACVAIFFNIVNVVLNFMLAAEYGDAASLHATTVVFFAVDIILLLYYILSARFKAIFSK